MIAPEHDRGSTHPEPLAAATPGMQLDARQRAMLAEMKIPFWWPQAAADKEPSPGRSISAKDTPVPARSAATTPGATPRAVATAEPMADEAVERMDWAQLQDAVLGCSACGLCEGRKGPVFVADPAPAQADWLIVGEPPDEQEERAGTPFVGAAGQLLDAMLRAVQVSRDGQGRAGARVTSVVKCRPAAPRNPTPDELAQCAAYLWREIALTRPRVIVAMGRFAALSLLGRDHPELLQLPLGQLRGKVYRIRGVAVVVSYHPSKLLRAPLQKAQAWADLCLARAQTLMPPSASP